MKMMMNVFIDCSGFLISNKRIFKKNKIIICGLPTEHFLMKNEKKKIYLCTFKGKGLK